MENASKALIIAGAILLSILIIGLGMTVFNTARNALNNANLSAEQIDAFNSKFEQYLGESVKGINVRSLCDLVKSSNATDEENQIKVSYGTNKDVTGQSEIQTLKNGIKTGGLYKVTATYSATTKLIDSITIEAI